MILTDPIKQALAYAAGGVILALLIWAGTLWVERSNLRLEVAKLNTGVALCSAANDSNLQAIATLQAQLEGWKKNAVAASAEAALAEQAARVAQVARSKASAALKAREAADAALPACDSLLATSLAAVCPAHAATIQERAK